MLISYAQNREDIYINWLLKGKKEGFYIDIGASDPIHLSVTNFFYQRGWQGINIEPIKRYVDLLNSQRPRDINLMLGVARESGTLDFREYPNADGLSSFSKEIQSQHLGISAIDYQVNVLPLIDILMTNLPIDRQAIDFMKIDVEGYEYEVIISNDWERFRPKLLIIESNHIVNDWHTLLEDYGYHKVFFDGLNEYFMPKDSISNELYRDFPQYFTEANIIDYAQYLKMQNTTEKLLEEVVDLQQLLNKKSWSYPVKQVFSKLLAKLDRSIVLPSLANPVSQLCTQNQFDEDIYDYWLQEIRESKRYHRKQWEFVYILQTLATNKLLTPGKKALGFGVGKEPLPAVFAKNGVSVLGTDLETESAVAIGWVATNEHAANLDDLNDRGICDPKEFSKLVNFQFADMNQIPQEFVGFDFCWSSCAFEHLGSIEAGLTFVENSLKCLKPGGLAIHTTEFNCQSDEDTIESGNTVLFRKRDILELESRLKNIGHRIHVNLNLGDLKLDKHIDTPPYSDNYHLKLLLEKYVTTSIGLIIQKAT